MIFLISYLRCSQLRSDGFIGAASAIANATMLRMWIIIWLTNVALNSHLENNLTRLTELVHAGILSEKEKERNLVVPDDPTAKQKVNYDGTWYDYMILTWLETSSVKKASFVTRFITTHKGSVRTAKFTRDGKYVVTGSADSSLKLLDVEKMHYHHQTKGEVEEYTQARPVIRTFYDHTAVCEYIIRLTLIGH
jgi:WD40 repeat protein